MTNVLAQTAAWLSAAANALGRFLLAPVGVVPGWLSATVVAAVTGVLLLAVFKYTSDQGAIQRVRNDINANLLALKLFKDSATVSLRAQGRILAGRLPALRPRRRADAGHGRAGDPAPGTARPLVPGPAAPGRRRHRHHRSSSTAMPASAWPAVSLQPTDAVEVTVGPVRVQSQREVCWNVKARERGSHRLVFQVGDRTSAKELAIGDGLMRVSTATTGLGLVGDPAEPLGGAVPARRPGPVDRDRLSATLFVDQRHRLVGDLLVRRLHGRRPVLPPRDERRRLKEYASSRED